MGTLRPINPHTASLIINPQAAAHDYNNLTHKPQINSHELSGDQSGSDLGLQNQLTAGDNVTIDENGVISAKGGTDDYNDLDNKPQINGVTLSGNKTSGELRVVGWKTAEIDNCIENGVLYSTSINNQAALVLANNITTDITQYAFCRDGRVMWRTWQAETAWQPAGEWRAWQPAGGWSEWEEIGGGSQIVSGVVNQNGTITFTDSDGNTFTTSGTSVIGPQGAPGNDYVLTAQDKADIADIVLQELPTTQGVLYGNTSN